MDRSPVQAVWIGETLPTIALLSIASFTKHGHPYHLYVYNPISNAPSSCVLKDANEILAKHLIYRAGENDTLACFSDWFRYELLFKKGGIYVDIDVVCLKPFDMSYNFYAAFGEHEKKTCNGAVIKVRARNLLIGWCVLFCRYPKLFYMIAYLYCRRPFKRRRLPWVYHEDFFEAMRYSTSLIRRKQGALLSHDPYLKLVALYSRLPKLLFKITRIKWFKRLSVIRPYYEFYPIAYNVRQHIVDQTYADSAKRDALLRNSVAIHVWNEGFVRYSPKIHPQSLLAQLIQEYLPTHKLPEQYTYSP